MDKPEMPRADKRVSIEESGQVELRSDSIECPLCAGRGKLARVEFYEKTGMREPSLIADLSATQAVERMHAKLWADFRGQVSEQVSAKTKDLDQKLLTLAAEKRDLERDVQQLREARDTAAAQARADQENKDKDVLLKERKQLQDQLATLQTELSDLRALAQAYPQQEKNAVNNATVALEKKLHGLELDRSNLTKEREALTAELTDARQRLEATKGKVEERSFEDMAAEIPGVWIENWSSKKQSGDYHIGLYDKDGEKLIASKIVVDNKDVGRLTDTEIEKLVRDALHHQIAIAAMVVSDESALRPKDKDARFAFVGGVTVLRTTRNWFQRDLDLLRPLMKRQAEEGPDFMKRNLAVAVEVRSHMKAIDNMEKFMRLARENAEKAESALKNYRTTIEEVCRNAGARDTSVTNDEE